MHTYITMEDCSQYICQVSKLPTNIMTKSTVITKIPYTVIVVDLNKYCYYIHDEITHSKAASHHPLPTPSTILFITGVKLKPPVIDVALQSLLFNSVIVPSIKVTFNSHWSVMNRLITGQWERKRTLQRLKQEYNRTIQHWKARSFTSHHNSSSR